MESVVCLAGWPLSVSPSCVGKQQQQNTFFFLNTCHAHRHNCLQPIFILFSGLDIGWESQGQRKAKHVNFIFLHTFTLIRMEFGGIIKKIKLNILILLLSVVFGRGIAAVLLFVSYQKKSVVDMHSQIYERIWF